MHLHVHDFRESVSYFDKQSSSIFSKPLNYAIALNELGSDVVHSYVGREPTGGKFNALELDYRSKQRRTT